MTVFAGNAIQLHLHYSPVSLLRQLSVIFLRHLTGRSADVQLEHSLSSLEIWKRDVDTLLESGNDGVKDEWR